MDFLVWAAILLCIGLALAMLEVFVPSGGLLGFLSMMAMLAAVILAFRHGPWSGIGFLGLAVFGVPAGLILALQWWPKTPMGRRILLPLPSSEEVLPDSDKRRSLKSLVGKIGKAKTLDAAQRSGRDRWEHGGCAERGHGNRGRPVGEGGRGARHARGRAPDRPAPDRRPSDDVRWTNRSNPSDWILLTIPLHDSELRLG